MSCAPCAESPLNILTLGRKCHGYRLCHTPHVHLFSRQPFGRAPSGIPRAAYKQHNTTIGYLSYPGMATRFHGFFLTWKCVMSTWACSRAAVRMVSHLGDSRIFPCPLVPPKLPDSLPDMDGLDLRVCTVIRHTPPPRNVPAPPFFRFLFRKLLYYVIYCSSLNLTCT